MLAIRLAAVGLAAVLGLSACGAGEDRAASIEPAALEARLGSDAAPLVLDVRSEAEFRSGHVPGARWIPYDEVARRLAELGGDRAREIVVICESGRRAAEAAQVLRSAGFERVVDLAGHMRAWREAGRALAAR